MLFWLIPGGFLRSNKLEQLEFQLEKNIGIKKHAGKVRKDTFLSFTKIDWVGVNYKVP